MSTAIVAVSHSRPLAEAAVALALQMGGATPPVVKVAAGTTDGGIGTDAAAIAAAIDEAGELFRPFADGPFVKTVADPIVRDRYYAAIAKQAKPDESQEQLAERQRRASTAQLRALKTKRLVAAARNGERVVWLP